MTPLSNIRLNLALAGTLSLLLSGTAYADGGRMLPRQVLPAYQQECGSCHVAYPASLLPASSWRRIMLGLDQHFGSDASLDTQTTQQIGAWLQAHAGTRFRDEPQEGKLGTQATAQDRITRSAWFVRKHRKIDPAVWQHTSVMSAAPGRSQASSRRSPQGEGTPVSVANCTACHADAAKGDFDEDRLRIPPGLDKRYLRAFQGD